MKIKTGTGIKRLNGKPMMTEQETMTDINGQPVIIGGMPQLTGGRDLTAGDVISTILTTKKVEQFNALKAFALAQRFYSAEVTDLDDSDYSGLRDLVERNDQFTPLVLAQVLRVLIEAKENNAVTGAKEQGASSGKRASRR